MSPVQTTYMRRALSTLPLALSLGVSGCFTSSEEELARLLRDLDTIERVPAVVVPSVAAATGAVPAVATERVGVSPSAVTQAPSTNPPSVAVGSPVRDAPAVVPAVVRVGQRELTIQPECIVQISVAEDPGLNGSYPVNDIGAAEIGYIGPVILYNKTEKEAAEKITEVLMNRGEFKAATVKVRILKASYGKVKVAGAVRQPGMIKVGAGDSISLNDALLRAGGLMPSAWGGRVRVYRDALLSAVPEAGRFEEYSLVTDAGRPCVPEVHLSNNDVASVSPPASAVADDRGGQPMGDKEILVLGEVGKPGFYRFSASERCTMMQLLFRLGLPKFANAKAIRIVRRDESGAETEIVVDGEKILEAGKPEDDVALENGDRIIVPEKKFTIF